MKFKSKLVIGCTITALFSWTIAFILMFYTDFATIGMIGAIIMSSLCIIGYFFYINSSAGQTEICLENYGNDACFSLLKK